jgi:hypothetical protein
MDVSSDGNTAVTGQNEGGVALWDIRAMKRASFLQAHNMGVNDVKLRENLILTASSDTCLKVEFLSFLYFPSRANQFL